MPYTVEVPKKVRKEIAAIRREDQVQIVAALEHLQDDPRPVGGTKLSGYENRFRIRVGDYRVLYEIRDQELRVLVIRVGHRREVYDH